MIQMLQFDCPKSPHLEEITGSGLHNLNNCFKILSSGI
jgi:hypothetical protein